jgi:CRISPR-associated protein Cas2
VASARLVAEIDLEADSLRLYYLGGTFKDVVETHGRNRAIDFEGPLIV